MTEPQDYLGRMFRTAHRLVIYRGILSDPIISAFLELLNLLSRDEQPNGTERLRAVERYAEIFSLLARRAATLSGGCPGSVLQRHLCELILRDINVFSDSVQTVDVNSVSRIVLRQLEFDFRCLQALYHFDQKQLCAALRRFDAETEWLDLDEFNVSGPDITSDPAHFELLRSFHEAPNSQSLLSQVEGYYRQIGTGTFAFNRAFHWRRTAQGGILQPIEEPDPILLENLIGYDDQKQQLVRNTRHFLAGYPSNNIFVYGDRGTGKSSAIKALLNLFTDHPLRMIEVSRDDLSDLPEVMKMLRPRRESFIIFVDDLSFEEGETQYKTLKAVLEGSLEARPKNVLIYATSNRRHLITEYFSDRGDWEGEEVRRQDTLQEKVSLADRFGIQLVFVAPDQSEYLSIVSSMVRQRGLTVSQDELKRRALEWVQLHNARSGRTARQFVDDLTGEWLDGQLA